MATSSDDAATHDEAPPSATPKERGDVLVRLHLSGWLTAFLTGLTASAVMVGREGLMPLFILAALFAPLSALLFVLAIGPWLRPWRQASGSLAFLALSACLALGLTVWTVISLGLAFILVPYLLNLGQSSGSPFEQILPALDTVLNGAPGIAWVGIWLAALAGCYLGRDQLKRHPLLLSNEPPAWRRALSLIFMLPYALVFFTVCSTVCHGARVDPDFSVAYGADIAAAVKNQGSPSKPHGPNLDHLPKTFSGLSPVKAWLAPTASEQAPKISKKDWAVIADAWCKEAASRWSGKDFWSNQELVALAKLAVTQNLIEGEDLDPARKLEIAVRSQVVLLDQRGVSVTQSQRFYDTQLPASTWGRLVELALSRPDLMHGSTLTEDVVRESFVAQGVKTLYQRDYDMDGNPQTNLLQRCEERAELNQRWHAFEKGKPYPEPPAPLKRDELAKRYAASLAFDLRAIDEDVTQTTFLNELARQDLAYNVVLMELKRLETEKKPLPKSWDGFRPAVAKLGQAYADWIELAPLPNGVRLRRKDPRHGLGLPHPFVEARG